VLQVRERSHDKYLPIHIYLTSGHHSQDSWAC